jgi:hypothetical protein
MADFNRDGHPDVVWQDPATGASQIWFLGGSEGTSVLGSANLTGSNPWRIVGNGDFNGDGRPDVLWQELSTGASQVWMMGGAQGATPVAFAGVSGANGWKISKVADFNNDGHPDLLWHDPVSGSGQVWFLSGSQGVTPQSFVPVPANAWRVVQ